MELICDACHTVVHIPDERVPPNTAFRVACPRCKQRIVAERRPPEAMTGEKGTLAGMDRVPGIPGSSNERGDESSLAPFGPLRPGQRASLVCIKAPEARTLLKGILEREGYGVDAPLTPQHALERLRFSQWHVILLDEAFGGTSPNPVAGYLEALTMSIRREMFVVLMGERFRTSDQMLAFVNSVDLVLHPADLNQLATLLGRDLAAREQFYRIFNECLIAAGKKI